jgi:N-acetylmuramoyl-L-alanine amidase
MTILLEDVLIGARTIYGEARGEPYNGMKAVGHVLINRWRFKQGDVDHSIAAAALRWLQFSAWNENDPNRERLQIANFGDPKFRLSVRAMLEAIDEQDFTSGARHYHTLAISPKWAQGHVPVMVIGAHAFYNDVA